MDYEPLENVGKNNSCSDSEESMDEQSSSKNYEHVGTRASAEKGKNMLRIVVFVTVFEVFDLFFKIFDF